MRLQSLGKIQRLSPLAGLAVERVGRRGLPLCRRRRNRKLRGRPREHGGKMAASNLAKSAAAKLGRSENADVLFFNGEMARSIDARFIRICIERKRRDNVILTLVTPGGDADVAYRMARCLQTHYQTVTIFIPGWCKSAGTLLAIGAHRLVMGPHGELGPLDIQLGKQDELFETGSGLDLSAALNQLENRAFMMFEKYMLKIEGSSGGRITFKTASEISSKIVSGLLGNIYAQIDPIKMGETTRLMNIAKDYGLRLAARSKNFRDEKGIDLLVSSYSSHGFVIDFEEACVIFNTVEMSNASYNALQNALGSHALYPLEDAMKGQHVLEHLNEEKVHAAKARVPAAAKARRRAGAGGQTGGGRPAAGDSAADLGTAAAAADSRADATVVTHPRAGTKPS